jgi:hypothetical protein
MSATYTGAFALRDKVSIDNDDSIVGYVTGVQFRSVREPLYEISYMNAGGQQTPWIEEFRLTRK